MNFLAITNSCSDPGLASILTIVRKVLGLIQIIGPILALLSIAFRLTMLMKNPDDKKGLPKLRNSAIALLVLFLVPSLVNAFFTMLGDSTTISSCWDSANLNLAREVTFVPVTDDQRTRGFISNPGDYEKGKPKPSSSTGTGTGTGTIGDGSAGPVSISAGTLVKSEETSTLKVYIYKNGGYYVTQVWAANPYQQLNKYDSPQYGKALYVPGALMRKAMEEQGLSSKLMVGFNASGFYLRNVYDAASVNAYSAYDKTSVGTLVITNGQVVRNAYTHAVKTWYIAGVDQSNRLRIFEDQKNSDASAKKAWSESVIGTVRNTFTFASPLVVNGQASNITTSMPSPGYGVKRQAMCQIDSNNFILITGPNLSRQNLIDIMLGLHCQTGTNFDGGGSIALLFKSRSSNKIETIIGNNRSLTEVGYFTE